MSFTKVFSNSRDVVEELQGAATRGEKLAVILWPTEQSGRAEEPPTLEAYVVVDEALTAYGLENDWRRIAEEVFQTLLSEQLQEVKTFERRSRRLDDSLNGKIIDATTFSTSIENLSLQVVHWEEWWQAFGGAHVADSRRFLLVNHTPLRVASDKNSS